MDMKQPKIGRPRKSTDGEVRSEVVKFLISPDEKAMLQKVAAAYGLTLSEYVRDWLLAEASKLEISGKKAAISTMCASVEDKARALGVEVEVKPIFKTYKTVGLSEIDED